jgi:hypothetical protein
MFGHAPRRDLIGNGGRAGSIKACAATSDTRLRIAPDIPTFAEMGLAALSLSGWFGLFVPKGTSRDIISKLNAAAIETLADPTVRTHPRRSAPCSGPTPQNGGRLSKSSGSRQSDPKLKVALPIFYNSAPDQMSARGHKQPTNHVRVGGNIFRKRTPRHASLKRRVPRHSGSVSPAARVGLSGAGFFCPWCRTQDICTTAHG